MKSADPYTNAVKAFEKSRKKQRLNKLDKYIIGSFVLLILFTVAVLTLISANQGASYDTLITCFFACFGGEVFAAALIKVFKLKEGKDED